MPVDRIRDRGPDEDADEIPLQIAGRIIRAPNTLTAKIELVPQFEDFIEGVHAETTGDAKYRDPSKRKSLTTAAEQFVEHPDDGRDGERRGDEVSEGIIHQRTKGPAVEMKSISQAIDGHRAGQKDQDHRREAEAIPSAHIPPSNGHQQERHRGNEPGGEIGQLDEEDDQAQREEDEDLGAS